MRFLTASTIIFPLSPNFPIRGYFDRSTDICDQFTDCVTETDDQLRFCEYSIIANSKKKLNGASGILGAGEN
jgi:hypothetical protein